MPCPSCGSALTTNPHYVQWCPSCNWNLDPLADQRRPLSRWQRLQQRFARRQSERLFKSVQERGLARRPLLQVAVFAASGIVHLITAAVLIGGVLILTNSSIIGLVKYGGSAICFLTFLVIQPFPLPNRRTIRDWRRPPQGLTAADAPHLFELLDRIATRVGTKPPDLVRVDARYNASIGVNRRKTTITIGMALWTVLDWPERIALLGHEFAHRVSGDSRRTRWTGRAIRSLNTWAYLLRPSRGSRRTFGIGASSGSSRSVIGIGGSAGALSELLVPVVLFPLTLLVSATGTVLDIASSWQGQRAEYRADLIAAQAVGSQPTAELLRRLDISETVRGERDRQIRFKNNSNPWPALAAYTAAIPDTELLRLERLAAQELVSIDSTHPPDELRRQSVLSRADVVGDITVDADLGRTIESELAPAVAKLSARIADGYLS